MADDQFDAAERSLLRRLHDLSREGYGGNMEDLYALAAETGVEINRVEPLFRTLEGMGWIEKPAMSWLVRLTPSGIAAIEGAGYASAESVAQDNRIRERLLLLLCERAGDRSTASLEELATAASCGVEAAVRNADLLMNCGLVEPPVASWYGATDAGVAEAQRLKAARARVEHFFSLKDGTSFSPQERGHELEQLIDVIASLDGWESDRQVRGSGEEQDLVLHREREYYLVECKWLRDPVEAGVVREFAGRVEARAGVRGLAISMSGFSAGAVEWARGKLSTCILLLFGPEDVESLVTQRRKFTELLSEKVHAVVMRRQIVWK